MQLVKFSATNFRSITKAHQIALSNVTVLIGKNNEGKSNLLRALEVAMQLLQRHARKDRLIRSNLEDYGDYNWKRDFPIQLQSKKSAANTVLKLEFFLNDEERAEFKKEIGSNLNGDLPLEIMIGKDGQPQIRLVKSGKGAKSLTTKSSAVANFIANRIYFNYIPAVRTDSESVEMIGRMLSQELRALEKDERYLQALSTIADLQQPILDELASRVEVPLKEFLPSIKSVRLEIPDQSRRYSLRRDVNVVVDDGTPTSLEHKGDGVKSLAALGLLKSQYVRPGASILAIEEPESHLHPDAIHQVNEIIQSISKTSQVIIATHNPLFVDRANIKSNIIVSDGAATPAKNISAIRDLLGIRASDNLTHANFALVLEGDEDVVALNSLLPVLSEKIGRALKVNSLKLEPIGGAGNLSYKLSLLKNWLCTTHVLLDKDEEGEKAFQKAEQAGLISVAGVTFVTCNGMGESEFEDCLAIDLYKNKVLEKFGVDLGVTNFRGSEKWSKRLRSTFLAQGKPFTERVLSDVKRVVADAVARTYLKTV